MEQKIKAIKLKAPNQVVLEYMAKPVLQRGDLLVKMKGCGLCGSDLEKISGEYTDAPPILGHEACGVVAEVNDVESFRVGDRVFPHHHVPCYDCHYCRGGSETMCPDYRRFHLDPCGFAEYFRVSSWIIRHGGVLNIPQSVSFEDGCFIEPTACCIRSLDRVGVNQGDVALVIGAGPIGLTHLQLLRLYGVSKVLVSEPSAVRLAQADRMNADVLYDPMKHNVASEVRRETGGRGVDLAIVASGNPKAIVQGLKSIRKGGRLCLFGVPSKGSELDYDVSELLTNEISITSSNAATEKDTTKAMKLIGSRKIDVRSMVTHRFGLGDFAKAVRVSGHAGCIKCIIAP